MKIKSFYIILMGIILSISQYGCYYDKEEILYPNLTPCDTTNVTYSVNISNTISNYCLSCHGSSYKIDGGNKRLDNYDNVVNNLDDIIIDITQDPNSTFNPMPKNSHKLQDCIIKQFVIWQQNGAPNN